MVMSCIILKYPTSKANISSYWNKDNFSKSMNNRQKWASLNENFIHVNIDNEVQEFIWKYNVHERSLILFLVFFVKLDIILQSKFLMP